MRRLLGLPFVLLFLPLVPAPADAATVCTVQLPTRVTAAAPVTWVSPTFTGCEGVVRARWYFTDSEGTIRGGLIGVDNGKSIGSWHFADSYPVGRYKVTPVTASGLEQNSTSTVVKFGTTISLKGYRQDHLKVPLTGKVTRYVASANGFRGWAKRTVSISYRDCLTCTWHSLALDRTDANGVFSLGAVSFEARYYRASIGETTAWWGRRSAAVHY